MKSWVTSIKVKWWLAAAKRKRKRCQEALHLLQKAIKAEPDHALALVQAGHCLNELARYDEAVDYFERALQLSPDYSEAHGYLSAAYRELGRNQEALESLNRAFRIKPGLKRQAYWLFQLGSVSGRLGLWNESLEAFQSEAKLTPREASAWEGIGWACSSLNRDSEAVDAYLRALQLDPTRVSILYDLAWRYLALKEFQKAEQSFRSYADAYQKSVELDPNQFDTLAKLGDACLQLDRTDAAISALNQAAKIEPYDANVHFLLAVCHLRAGNSAETSREYEIVKQLDATLAKDFAKLLTQ